ncbi:MAG: ankyrin repeat domain-containing protein [Phycisphaerales bacterium JB037]
MSRTGVLAAAACLTALGLVPGVPQPEPRAVATETDQYTMPVGRRFLDMGIVLSRDYYDSLERAVAYLNDRIDEANAAGAPLDRWHDPLFVARAFRGTLPAAVLYIEMVEAQAKSEEVRRRFPGRIGAFKGTIYESRSLLDPTYFFTWHISATIMVDGVYLGTDKIGHFFDKGFMVFRRYREIIDAGGSVAEAKAAAAKVGAGENFILGEKAILGLWSSGVYSNSDLAVDYAGGVFYRNLTEPVLLNGVERAPMLVRDGDHWRIAEEVSPDSDFWTKFISHHFNEALNPSLYKQSMRELLREAVRERAPAIRAWYADVNGSERPPAHFAAVLDNMFEFHGDEYGHWGEGDQLITIHETCYDEPTDLFEAIRDDRADLVASMWDDAALTARNEAGATTLHAAIARPGLVRWMLERGVQVQATDPAGRTPLHWAAAVGDTESIALLLAHGADPNAADALGRTPLHDAARFAQPASAERLLAAGADPNHRARLGMTPLHYAARIHGSDHARGIASELLAAGAEADLPDAMGWTPLHHAASQGNAEAVSALLAAGVAVDPTDASGSRPLHLALRGGWHSAARELFASGADAASPNAFGSTPLHEAAFGGDVEILGFLLEQGADETVRDGLGRTPRRIALDQGDPRAAARIAEFTTRRLSAERSTLGARR